jgi:hypothetical protein
MEETEVARRDSSDSEYYAETDEPKSITLAIGTLGEAVAGNGGTTHSQSDERKHESRKRIEERVWHALISSPIGRGRQEGGRRAPDLSERPANSAHQKRRPCTHAEERGSRGSGGLASRGTENVSGVAYG